MIDQIRQEAPPPGRRWGVWTFTALAALVSATATPEPAALATLAGWGFPDFWAHAALYAAPVVLVAALLTLAQWLGRRSGRLVRYFLLFAAGLIVGFGTSFCLTIFAGVEPMLAAIAGPLQPASDLDGLAWIFAGFSIALGAITLVFAVFGANAAKAMQLEELDSEALDIRRKERSNFAWASLGLIGQGFTLGGLALAHQAGDPMIGLAACGFGAVLFTLSSVVLRRGYDEFLRRVVMDAYAASAILFTIGLLVWAVLEAGDITAPLTGYGALLAFCALQTVVTMVRSSVFHGVAKPMPGAAS